MSNKKTKKKSTIAELWEKIFEEYSIKEHIVEQGYFKITAEDIKQYKEPRLMTKFDNSSVLPSVFHIDNDKNKEHLSILPTSRGDYIIGAFDAYHPFEKASTHQIKRITFPTKYETLNDLVKLSV